MSYAKIALLVVIFLAGYKVADWRDKAASEAAQKYFNWETESGKLLQYINQLSN